MHKNLILFSVLYIFLSLSMYGCWSQNVPNPETRKPFDYILRADNKDEIIKWIKQHGTYGDIYEFQDKDNSALVLLEDTGSGLRLDTIYIFGKTKEMKEWRLVLIRPTLSEVVVVKEGDRLVFTTKSGKSICEQKFDTLGLFPMR